MSAAVCGSKRFFEDIPTSPSAPVSKKVRRCSTSSPVRFSPPRSPLDHLQALFPLMDPELLERALLECENDIDAAITRLQELCLGGAEATLEKPGPIAELGTLAEPGALTNDGEAAAAVSVQNPSAPENLPVDGAGWVDFFVRELVSSTSMDEAKARASRLLEILEKSIKHAAEESAQNLHKENITLKEQIQVFLQENTVLKRAVAIQHERQKEYQEKNNELQHLKQLVSQYQEQLRTLEVNNYALTMHLRQAQQSSAIPGRFHPDVF
ncbi:Ubiquitin system component Cue [Corchorus olitorius]|uniref:Ubiquitin system component Cue n=1 Tax=Corchorus olitorius TaxID=93759 RepID=A0A1R3K2R8_9ROSI|nr:Ubiquitin system component Cue [Corchorus olitorius]